MTHDGGAARWSFVALTSLLAAFGIAALWMLLRPDRTTAARR